MEIKGTYASCEGACFSSGRFSVAFLDSQEMTKRIHSHDHLEIYFSVTGGKRFIIDEAIYPMSDNDIFIINPFQTHLAEAASGEKHLRYIFSIMPQYLKSISSPSTNLLSLFYSTDKHPPKITLRNNQKEQLIQTIHRLSNVQGYGADLMENSLLIEVILMLLSASGQTSGETVTSKRYIEDILSYIDNSLDKNLSLDMLSSEFYLSKGYLCRLFKEHTGTTVNKYVLAKRIDSAKQLLSMGCSVQETAGKTGFNDYASFIRRFKEDVGVSPKKYGRESAIKLCCNGNSDRRTFNAG